jgi:hypothetical protein
MHSAIRHGAGHLVENVLALVSAGFGPAALEAAGMSERARRNPHVKAPEIEARPSGSGPQQGSRAGQSTFTRV